MNVWDAYGLGIRLRSGWPRSLRGKACRLLNLVRHPAELSDLFTPIDYVRYREFDFVLKAIGYYKPSPVRVLDIASPKLLPLTVGHNIPTAEVHMTDILWSEVQPLEMAAECLDILNVVSEVQDARVLGYADGQFDLVTSVSVFEHIAPEKGGEVPAARELGRVMASGGIAVITVPFSRAYFAEYRVGQIYERASTGDEPVFFQRFYDYGLLMRNIVQASGLDVLYLGFLEERYFFRDPHKRLAHCINGSRKQKVTFGPWFPLLSHIFLSSSKSLEKCRKPYIACLVLKRT